MAIRCKACGKLIDERNWHFRYDLPPLVADSLAKLAGKEFWGNDDLLHAWGVWELPECRELKLKGMLANKLKGWPLAVLNQCMNVAVQRPQ